MELMGLSVTPRTTSPSLAVSNLAGSAAGPRRKKKNEKEGRLKNENEERAPIYYLFMTMTITMSFLYGRPFSPLEPTRARQRSPEQAIWFLGAQAAIS